MYGTAIFRVETDNNKMAQTACNHDLKYTGDSPTATGFCSKCGRKAADGSPHAADTPYASDAELDPGMIVLFYRSKI